jgi:hypothetical protein
MAAAIRVVSSNPQRARPAGLAHAEFRLLPVFKSSTKDLSFPIFVITIQHTLSSYYLIRKKVRCNFMMLDTKVSIAIHEDIRKGYIVYSSMDSDVPDR